MKKLKFSKSEYILLTGTIGVLGTLIVFLLQKFGVYDGNETAVYSLYSAVAVVWFTIFYTISTELKNKRWLTKKEKDISYLIFFTISAVCFIIEGCPLVNIIPFAVTTVIWVIARFVCLYTPTEELNAERPSCDDPYFYESDEKTLKDFKADGRWYNKRKEKQLRTTYIDAAKEFSGKISKIEIEMTVRNRIMTARLRLQRIALCSSLIFFAIALVIGPIPMPDIDLGWVGYIFSALHLYSVFSFVACTHDPLTPLEDNPSSLFEKVRNESDGTPRT